MAEVNRYGRSKQTHHDRKILQMPICHNFISRYDSEKTEQEIYLIVRPQSCHVPCWTWQTDHWMLPLGGAHDSLGHDPEQKMPVVRKTNTFRGCAQIFSQLLNYNINTMSAIISCSR